MNKVVVGYAPSPNLMKVQSRIGSLSNTDHKVAQDESDDDDDRDGVYDRDVQCDADMKIRPEIGTTPVAVQLRCIAIPSVIKMIKLGIQLGCPVFLQQESQV